LPLSISLGIYVNRIVKSEITTKRIERLTLSTPNQSDKNKSPAANLRDRIVRRAAKEFKDGDKMTISLRSPF
jgi:3-oxoacid CoA-transferase